MMRVWNAYNEEHDLLFVSVTAAQVGVEERAGLFSEEYEFAGKMFPPERWEWEFDGVTYTYADWTVEPVEVLP